jgi:hypothetical protein
MAAHINAYQTALHPCCLQATPRLYASLEFDTAAQALVDMGTAHCGCSYTALFCLSSHQASLAASASVATKVFKAMPACRSSCAAARSLRGDAVLSADSTLAEHREVFHAIRLKERRHLTDVPDLGGDVCAQVTENRGSAWQDDLRPDASPLTRYAFMQTASQDLHSACQD